MPTPNMPPVHPAADLYPMMSSVDLFDLAEDIARNGQNEACILWRGQLLDGRNRWQACAMKGIEPKIIHRNDIADPIAFVHSHNLHRRHLTPSQRAMVAAKTASLYAEDARRRQLAGKPAAKLPEGADIGGEARELAAAAVGGVSPRSVGDGIAVVKSGNVELVRAVEAGKVAVSTAAGLARAEIPQREVIKILEGGEEAILKAAKEIRGRKTEERRQQRIAGIAEMSKGNTPLLPGPVLYPVLRADCPWKYRDGTTDPSRVVENKFPPMELEAICALPVSDIATPDAILFLDYPPGFASHAAAVVKAWGFVEVSGWSWHKDGPPGPGYYGRMRHELVMIAKRGDIPPPPVEARFDSVIDAPRGEFAEKPAEIARRIEAMYPDLPRIELFARVPRPGWAVWGNQAGAPIRSAVDLGAEALAGAGDEKPADEAPAEPAAPELAANGPDPSAYFPPRDDREGARTPEPADAGEAPAGPPEPAPTWTAATPPAPGERTTGADGAVYEHRPPLPAEVDHLAIRCEVCAAKPKKACVAAKGDRFVELKTPHPLRVAHAAAALLVDCPKCGEKAGKPCREPARGWKCNTHDARIQRAKEEQAGTVARWALEAAGPPPAKKGRGGGGGSLSRMAEAAGFDPEAPDGGLAMAEALERGAAADAGVALVPPAAPPAPTTDPALRVRCSLCHAKPGEGCRTPGLKEPREPHRERRRTEAELPDTWCLLVACPKCKAAPSAPCRSPSGTKTTIHNERQDAAAKGAAGATAAPPAKAAPVRLLFQAGDRLEITGAPIVADNGVFDIASTSTDKETGSQVFRLHRVLKNGKSTDEAPIGASTNWYRMNHRTVSAELVQAHGKRIA